MTRRLIVGFLVLLLAAAVGGCGPHWLQAEQLSDSRSQLVRQVREVVRIKPGERMYSPDGTLYVELVPVGPGNGEQIELVDAAAGRRIGRYRGRFIMFYGWHSDSAGFFVTVYLPPGPSSGTWWSGARSSVRLIRVTGR